MYTFTTTFIFSIICLKVKLCVPALRVLQVEQIFNNKVVIDNLLADYGHSSSSLCTLLCQQEKCECIGFNSVTQTCRIHSFCRPDNTIINESGWTYYRTSKFCCLIITCIYYLPFPLRWCLSYKCIYQMWLFYR